MIRRPPRSTLFPYTRSSDLPGRWCTASCARGTEGRCRGSGSVCFTRSEEHTSELQSRLHLVCRLLLEKKKRLIFSPLRDWASSHNKQWNGVRGPLSASSEST